MELEDAIHGRRTHKAFAPEPVPHDERFVALIHLGRPRQEKEAPEREPLARVVTYTD